MLHFGKTFFLFKVVTFVVTSIKISKVSYEKKKLK